MVRGAIRPCTRMQSSDRARARGIHRHPLPTIGRDYGYGPERVASVGIPRPQWGATMVPSQSSGPSERAGVIVDPRPQGGAATLAW